MINSGITLTQRIALTKLDHVLSSADAWYKREESGVNVYEKESNGLVKKELYMLLGYIKTEKLYTSLVQQDESIFKTYGIVIDVTDGRERINLEISMSNKSPEYKRVIIHAPTIWIFPPDNNELLNNFRLLEYFVQTYFTGIYVKHKNGSGEVKSALGYTLPSSSLISKFKLEI